MKTRLHIYGSYKKAKQEYDKFVRYLQLDQQPHTTIPEELTVEMLVWRFVFVDMTDTKFKARTMSEVWFDEFAREEFDFSGLKKEKVL